MSNEPSVRVITAVSVLTKLRYEGYIDGIPLSPLTKNSGSVYKTTSKAIEFLLSKKLVKSRVVNVGKRSMTTYIFITLKGERELARWCDE